MSGVELVRTFVQEMTALMEAPPPEKELLDRATQGLSRLVTNDDWLPDDFAVAHPEHYQQYLLHCDPLGRFSLVSFVWGPGQSTPVHDHTVWGLIGMLRGGEVSESYRLAGEGRPMEKTGETRLVPGQVERVSPTIGDIHRVANAHDDRVSISIHLYGANIGEVSRHVYDPLTGRARSFVSGYANTRYADLWATVQGGRSN